MATREKYDAIVIGAGRAALFLGPPLVQAGWRTALIEREYSPSWPSKAVRRWQFCRWL